MTVNPEPPDPRPKFKVRLKECPVCKHPWPSHDDQGACTEKDCWCLYQPPEEDVEAE